MKIGRLFPYSPSDLPSGSLCACLRGLCIMVLSSLNVSLFCHLRSELLLRSVLLLPEASLASQHMSPLSPPWASQKSAMEKNVMQMQGPGAKCACQ